MRTACFTTAWLPLLAILGTACHQAGDNALPKAAEALQPKATSSSAPFNAAESVSPAPRASDEAPGQAYEAAVNGPLARYVRGEPMLVERQAAPRDEGQRQRVEFVCVATGEFNIAPSGDHLLMETMCAERNPGESVTVLHVADVEAPRVPDKLVFQISFKDAVVSVQDVGGKPEVRLHYRDASGTFHHVDLAARQGQKYAYSFARLTPDTVEPIGESRTIEIER